MTEIDGVVYKITQTQASCFKTAFGIFDVDGDGYITHNSMTHCYCASLREFVKLFRSVGQSPSDATLKRILDEFDPEKKDKIGLHTFLQICESPFFVDPIKEERLLECFRVFDGDALGRISAAELRFILQQMGEPLTDDEADKFIEWAMKVPDAITDGGLLNYDILARELINRDPDVS
ncbi:putative calmodulin [Cyclospora cayetanensis]|uniref:Calmodulin n=1 Tax=Cyclospora cayetanensis TaxID=88456 RepID=A0A1D3D7I4_9EIME|nr:putative calmodulin [Cyclospora cayetanensis]